jgi:hypothetical protein
MWFIVDAWRVNGESPLAGARIGYDIGVTTAMPAG